VLEAGDRPGGVVASVVEDGFLIERAASSLRPGASAILETIRELGLGDDLLEAAPAARKRWLLHRGRLVRAPSSPFSLFGTPLLSARAKLRMFKEPWIPRGGGEDESLAGFVARRFGDGLVEPMLDAVITGIYAGDPRRLEARAALPRITELEERHGSVLRGFWREARVTQRTTATRARSRARRPALFAMRGGMQQIVDRLAAELGDAVHVDTRVDRIERVADADRPAAGVLWGVIAGPKTFSARSVFLATPSWVSARLLDRLDATLSRELAAIEAANVAVVGIGLRREQVAADVDGLGFLVPSAEGTPLLGVLYESSLFPNRAPDGHVLLRAMIGGERLRLPEDPRAVAELAWREASRILGLTGAPRLLRAFLHRPGIPQYRPGHTARLRRIGERLSALPGLTLGGWCYRGIALDDRAKEARTT
jgi:oxygen-dependent protoporphyrinogen oxidase